jgi:hypothetical protein
MQHVIRDFERALDGMRRHGHTGGQLSPKQVHVIEGLPRLITEGPVFFSSSSRYEPQRNIK